MVLIQKKSILPCLWCTKRCALSTYSLASSLKWRCLMPWHCIGGWRKSRHLLSFAAFWFSWRMLRRLPKIWEVLQIWRESFLDWLSWRMVTESWESLVLWRYLNWLSCSSSLMVTSHAILSSEVPHCFPALVACRMLAAAISPCNQCFYCFRLWTIAMILSPYNIFWLIVVCTSMTQVL